MRVLIIGATGLLGKVLLNDPEGERYEDQVTGAGSRDVDIREQRQVHQLFVRCRPEWTVLAAAYTDGDGCEKGPERAHQVKCTRARNVAEAGRDAGARRLFGSTAYGLDGCKGQPYAANDQGGR